MKNTKGLIHVYTGKGKGKSTAALGLALRASGWGMNVCVYQFMKKGVNGANKAAKFLSATLKVVTFDQTHPSFYHKDLKKKAKNILQDKITQDLKTVKETLLLGNYDIVILDEIVNAIKEKYIEKKEILSLLDLKFRTSELILTGRGAPKWLVNKADYATEMRLVKHPYYKGIKARKGIEY
ncbi:MAG: cob(I)yrinic acid a,c-diamide adenosyltransferase [Candidatus Omnitrophica bacterium]|nr:cob(I)yrinic acid a,c-diamide adenosyltransferase [Candidatus Omnitrophota bacterium]